MRPPHAERIEHAERVARQLLHGVVAARRLGKAVAAEVGPDHAVRAGQRRRLRVPDMQGGAE